MHSDCICEVWQTTAKEVRWCERPALHVFAVASDDRERAFQTVAFIVDGDIPRAYDEAIRVIGQFVGLAYPELVGRKIRFHREPARPMALA